MQKYLRKSLIFLAVILFVLLSTFALFDLFYNRIFLPPELVSKTESLFKSPTKIPDWVQINPPPSSVLRQGEPIEIKLFVCHLEASTHSCDKSLLRVKGGSYEATGLYNQWSSFYVNGQQTRFLWYAGGGNIVGTITGSSLTKKVSPALLQGYHLFKVEPAKSQEEQHNSDPNLSYEWVYRVE